MPDEILAINPVFDARALDLKQLERFVVTADQGSIGAAANQLGLSQPALTRSIQMLEDTLGSQLFDRLPRGVRLTVLGTRILPYARLMVRERARLKEAVDEFLGLLGGLITFGVSNNLLDSIAAEAVIQFRKKRPDLRMVVRSGSISELLEMLQDGSLDLALCTIGSHAIPETLRFEALFDKMTSIVVRKQHPLAQQSRVSFQELASADWVVMGGAAAMEGLRRTFERHGAVAPPYAIRCESLSFIRSCVMKDDYVAMLDQSYIAQDLKSGDVRVLATETEGIPLVSGLLSRRDGPRSIAVSGFVQIVRRCAKTR